MQFSVDTLHLMYSDHFTRTLRLHKRMSGFTTEEIAQKVEKSKSTVDKWITGEQTAQGATLIALGLCFGPSFLNDLYRPFGFSGLKDVEESSTNPFCVNAALADGLAELSRSLGDGRIDHTERPKVIDGLRSVVNQATALLNQLEGARDGQISKD